MMNILADKESAGCPICQQNHGGSSNQLHCHGTICHHRTDLPLPAPSAPFPALIDVHERRFALPERLVLITILQLDVCKNCAWAGFLLCLSPAIRGG